MPLTRTPVSGRRRAKKACIPCHQRKRKCDAGYPCAMCTKYEYRCRYSEGIVAAPSQQSRSLNGTGIDASTGTGYRGEAESRPSRPHRPPRNTRAQASQRMVNAAPSDISPATDAFPRTMSLALGSDDPPKTHSFAYNFGLSADEDPPPSSAQASTSLRELVTEEEVAYYSQLFFSQMASLADYLDPDIYDDLRADYFNDGGVTRYYGAIIASVVALGSFLAPERHPREASIVRYAKSVLDDPASMCSPTTDLFIAWSLYTFYLRATAEPNNAWMASCSAMHLAEVLGLHREETVKRLAASVGIEEDRLRRKFWISWAGHNLLTYEYDRSAVQLRDVATKTPSSGSVADQFVQMIQIIPAPNSPLNATFEALSPSEQLIERVKMLGSQQYAHPFLTLTKADILFSFYRRLYQIKAGMLNDAVDLIVDAGNAAVHAAKQLIDQRSFFWNVIGSVFHYVCVLLSIDTAAALSNVGPAIDALERFVKVADTASTRETLAMAKKLLSLSVSKKRKELDELESIGLMTEQPEPVQEVELEQLGTIDAPDFGWGVDWSQLLIEPYMSMLSNDVHF